MDVRTITRVDIKAVTKVTTDTTPVCLLLPEGILQITALVLVSTLSMPGSNMQH